MSTMFDPNNNIIKLCMRGIACKEEGNTEKAVQLFHQAWQEATNDFEKFISAYHLGGVQTNAKDAVHWLRRSLACALRIEDMGIKSALPRLYDQIAQCFEALGDRENAKMHSEHSKKLTGLPMDPGPFYHGTKADLKVGDLLTAGGFSNYQNELKMNHIYFTANLDGAGLAAALAKGDGMERVYIVEPTGAFENDPNVTDKKFPGNLARSYRSQEPLRIVGEVADWGKLTWDQRREWEEKLANNKGDIIN